MRIEPGYSEPQPRKIELRLVKSGTVFLYGEHSCGPYLRVDEGIVDLKLDRFYSNKMLENFSFTSYLELPNARLMTGVKCND